MCVIVALDMKMLSWFDLLLCANHRHIHRDCWHKGKALEHGWRCSAAAVLLLFTDLVTTLRAAAV